MIKEPYRFGLLTAKEMLSSEGERYPESMAPLIGGRGPGHGTLQVLGPEKYRFKRWWKPSTFEGEIIDTYYKQQIVIDDENEIYVYRIEPMDIKETEGILTAWAHTFIQGQEPEPMIMELEMEL